MISFWKNNNEICKNDITKVVKAVQGVTHICNIPISIFRPSWTISALGYFPFIGNITNFGCAIYAYQNGDPAYGHKKMAEALVGTLVDVYTPAGCDRLATEFARRTMARIEYLTYVDFFYYLKTPPLNKNAITE